MATKRTANVVTPESIVEMPAQPISLSLEANDLASLKMQQAAIREQIKALKATQTKRTSLEQIIQWQNTHYEAALVRRMANRIKARVAAGQPRQEAADAVTSFFRDLVDQRLDYAEMDSNEPEQEEEV